MALAASAYSLYALLGATAGRWLTSNARFRHRQRLVTGSIDIALGDSAAAAGAE